MAPLPTKPRSSTRERARGEGTGVEVRTEVAVGLTDEVAMRGDVGEKAGVAVGAKVGNADGEGVGLDAGGNVAVDSAVVWAMAAKLGVGTLGRVGSGDWHAEKTSALKIMRPEKTRCFMRVPLPQE